MVSNGQRPGSWGGGGGGGIGGVKYGERAENKDVAEWNAIATESTSREMQSAVLERAGLGK